MVSLISTVNKQQTEKFFYDLMEDLYNHTMLTMGVETIVFAAVMNKKVVTFSLKKRHFKVFVTGYRSRHTLMYHCKTTMHSAITYYRSVKRFLSAILDINPTDHSRQVKRTFNHMISRYGVPYDKLSEEYLLIVEKIAIARWKQRCEDNFVTWSLF